MTTYYISYGEPRRRRRWVFPALGVLGLAALLAVGATFLLSSAAPTGPDEPAIDSAGTAASASATMTTTGPSAPAAPTLRAPASEEQWYDAIATATSETAITYYLIDTSESMTRELPNAMQGLNAIIAEKSPGSQVGVIAFGDTCVETLPLSPLTPEVTELAAQGDLVDLEIGMAGLGTDVSCAFAKARRDLQPYLDAERATEVVLFSDGDLAAVLDAECSGDVVSANRTQEGSPLIRCRGEWSYEPMPIIKQFDDAEIKINGIYFRPHLYNWADQVELLTTATGGVFVPVGRAAR